MRTAHILVAMAVVAALAACGGPARLRAHVETFSTLAASPLPTRVAVVPFGSIDADSLEFRRYRERLTPLLEARGFEVVATDAQPPYLLELGYRVDEGRQVVETIGSPAYYRYPRYGARGWPYDPFYYDRWETISYTVYGRHLVLVLVDAESGAEVWRASAFNVGSDPSLAPVFDAMVDAAFADFPAERSGDVVVTLEPDA